MEKTAFGNDKVKPNMGNSQKQKQQPLRDDYEHYLIPTDFGLSVVPIILFTADAVFSRGNSGTRHLGEKFHLTFKLVHTECKIVKTLLSAYGFHEVHPSSPDFNLTWTNSHIKPGALHSLSEYQKVNHFPRSFELTRKDRLYKNIQQMQQTKKITEWAPIEADPSASVQCTEAEGFHGGFTAIRDEFRKWRGLWIVKPLALSRGRGIYIISRPDELPVEEPVLVAKYVDNPFLINGYKFDLRLYVAVTSFDPLVIYLYNEGLARFATEKYRKGVRHVSNQCMHLTNYSVNRHSANYVRCFDPNVDDYGNKWSLSALMCYLERKGCNTSVLLAQIKDIIIKSLIAAEFPISSACKLEVPNYGNCFELFGFDVLLDDSFRPWLLEINFSPSLACDMPLDLKIKSKLVADLLTLTGVVAHDPLLLRFQRKRAASGIITNSNKSKHSEAGSSPGRNSGKKIPKQQAQVSAEEYRITQMVQDEMDRCGDFMRIFPTANTWELYGDYFSERQSYTVMVHKFLYPSVSKFVFSSVYRGKTLCKNLKSQEQTHQLPKKLELAKKLMSAALAKALPSDSVAKDGGEEMAMVSKGFNAKFNSLDACSVESEGSDENPVIRLLKMDETLSQVQARRVFALYLHKVGERLEVIMKNENLETDAQSAQNFKQQLELVLQFLNYASENLLYSVEILSPEEDAGIYDQGKFLLTQLVKFLHSYNEETERMAEAIGQDDREYFVPRDLFEKFVESARAFELEEVLMIVAEHHSTSWFLGTKVRNSNWCSSRSNAVVDTAELGLSNLRNFHYFFPPKSLSVPECAAAEHCPPLASAQLRRSYALVAEQQSKAVAQNNNNTYNNNNGGKENKLAMAATSDRYAASFRSLTEADYLIGEFRRVKSSLYRAARIYTSKHTL